MRYLFVQLFVPPALIGMNEVNEFWGYGPEVLLRMGTVIPVALSCFFGLMISYFGFASRKAISATAYTVVGVTNKLLTVLVNLMIWDKHAEAGGIVALLVCIYGGYMYQQSVTKIDPPEPEKEQEMPIGNKIVQVV